MKRPLPKGSVEWFEHSRRRCVDHLRALLSVQIARDSATAILQHWNSQSALANAGLHSSCVIAYSRPFVYASTKEGKTIYPVKALAAAQGFDKELHVHILDLRNKLIAHSDYDMFPSTMYVQTIGDEKLPLTLGINVKGIFGIGSSDLASRYEKHLSACVTAIEQILNFECKELASEARIHPSQFQETHNIPSSKSDRFTFEPTFKDIPPPTGPAADVADPAFSEGLAEYRYITLTHQISLVESGKYRILENGIAKEITLSSE